MRDSSFLTVPNLLSLSRLPMAAAFLAADSGPARLALLGMASATDFLDGWFARRSTRVSALGALLDPIADKVFVVAALTAFLISGELSGRDYCIVLARDVATAIGFLVAVWLPGLDVKQFRARLLGKVATGLQLAALVALLLAPPLMRWLVPVIAAVSIAAIVDYTLALHRARVSIRR